jgi:hypothetical protein
MRAFVQKLPLVHITNLEERSKIETSLIIHDMALQRDLLITILDKVTHSYIN